MGSYTNRDTENEMDKEEIIEAVAELVVGLQVPVSMAMPLGTATEPWRKLKDELAGFGWTSKEIVADALRKKLA